MLIRSLRAENFMKFASLRLRSFPREGVIGIEGPNESGKSTIGEAILFAIFGRTRLTKGCPLEDLIRWGTDHLRVDLEFTLRDEDGAAQDYLIYREIDRHGTNYVKLLALPARQELATGNSQVGEHLGRLVGFDFFEFQQAFYHDQFESRSVDSAVLHFVERMTGVVHMNTALVEIRRVLEQLEREHGHYQKDIARNERQAERYAKSIARLPELVEQTERLAREHDESRARVDAGKRCLDALKRLAKHRESCSSKLKALSRASGKKLLDGMKSLWSDYERFDFNHTQGAGPGAGALEEIRKEFSSVRKKLGGVNRFLADYASLCESFVAAREAMETDVDADSADNLLASYHKGEAERAAVSRTASGGRWKFWVSAFVGLGALALGTLPWTAPEITREWLAAFERQLQWQPPEAWKVAIGCLLAGAGLCVYAVWRIVRARNLAVREAVLGGMTADLWGRVESTRAAAESLRGLEAITASGDICEYLDGARPHAKGATAKKLEEFETAHAALLEANGGKDEKGFRRLLAQLSSREKQLLKKVEEVRGVEEKALKELQGTVKKLRSDRDRVENDVRECHAQQAKNEALEETNAELHRASNTIFDEVEERRLACQLLEDTILAVRSKLGPTLAGFMRQVLPYLTNGRYRDVKVGDDLGLQVYVEDRCDFLAPKDLSGGTHEAIVLALRLAFSQGFVLARSKQHQFLFFDEPFKMMDVERAVSSLRAMKDLSPHLRQFFVIQPDYTEEQRRRFDYVLRTDLETSELEIDFQSDGETLQERV